MLLARKNQDLVPSLINELMDWNGWNTWAMEEHAPMPKMNVSESDADYQLELCVPGIAKEAVRLCVDADNNLIVEVAMNESEASEKQDQSSRHYLRHEFSDLHFKQMFTLPESVKKSQISAKVENGILTIALPKFSEEEKRASALTIEVA